VTVKILCRAAFLLSPLIIAVVPAFPQDDGLPDGLYAEIKTDRGTIVCSLEYQRAPMTVTSFVGLAEGTIPANGVKGKKFFDGLTFHRVEPGFVIQGGDPKGNGTGGSGKTIPLEIAPSLTHKKGAVGMARSQEPNSASSQFYICLEDAKFLDKNYAVFGQVIEGQSVASNIRKGDKIVKATIQ
jgi:cyclophilin family peptidyl-prolyl cis-trans isomerase